MTSIEKSNPFALLMPHPTLSDFSQEAAKKFIRDYELYALANPKETCLPMARLMTSAVIRELSRDVTGVSLESTNAQIRTALRKAFGPPSKCAALIRFKKLVGTKKRITLHEVSALIADAADNLELVLKGCRPPEPLLIKAFLTGLHEDVVKEVKLDEVKTLETVFTSARQFCRQREADLEMYGINPGPHTQKRNPDEPSNAQYDKNGSRSTKKFKKGKQERPDKKEPSEKSKNAAAKR